MAMKEFTVSWTTAPTNAEWYPFEYMKNEFINQGFTVENDTQPSYSASGTREIEFSFQNIISNIIISRAGGGAIYIYLKNGSAQLPMFSNYINYRTNSDSLSGSISFRFIINDYSFLLCSVFSYTETPLPLNAITSYTCWFRPKVEKTGDYVDLLYKTTNSVLDWANQSTVYSWGSTSTVTRRHSTYPLPTFDLSSTSYMGKILTLPYMATEIGTASTLLKWYVPNIIYTNGFPADAPNLVEIGGDMYFRRMNIAVKIS